MLAYSNAQPRTTADAPFASQARADARWGVADPTIVSIELLTVSPPTLAVPPLNLRRRYAGVCVRPSLLLYPLPHDQA